MVAAAPVIYPVALSRPARSTTLLGSMACGARKKKRESTGKISTRHGYKHIPPIDQLGMTLTVCRCGMVVYYAISALN